MGVAVKIHCPTPAAVADVWRMLSHVPDADFVPAEIWQAGEFAYLIVRTDGEQTSAQPANLLGQKTAAL